MTATEHTTTRAHQCIPQRRATGCDVARLVEAIFMENGDARENKVSVRATYDAELQEKNVENVELQCGLIKQVRMPQYVTRITL